MCGRPNRVACCGLRVASCALRVTRYVLHLPNSRFGVADFGLEIVSIFDRDSRFLGVFSALEESITQSD